MQNIQSFIFLLVTKHMKLERLHREHSATSNTHLICRFRKGSGFSATLSFPATVCGLHEKKMLYDLTVDFLLHDPNIFIRNRLMNPIGMCLSKI